MKSVCVSGLGCIGLPLASLVASAGYPVRGVDTNPEVIEKLEFSEEIFLEPDLLAIFRKERQAGRITFALTPHRAEIHIIAVPTKLDRNNNPDLSCIDAAVEGILPFLRPNDLLLVESTCPIGKTDTLAKWVREVCPETLVAYCPERVLPGNILQELRACDRILGGVDELSSQEACHFYKSFVHGKIHVTDAKTAEACKLSENAFRDVNIAFANELSMILEQRGVDAREVISLANCHPRVQILKPSSGVGGYCLPVNTWLLASSSPKNAPLLKAAREVNRKKTEWVYQRIIERAEEGLVESIACLGLTYKENVSETRNSIALELIDALQEKFRVLPVDPYVPDTIPLQEALADADLIVGLVAHDAFRKISPDLLEGKEVLDLAGVFL